MKKIAKLSLILSVIIPLLSTTCEDDFEPFDRPIFLTNKSNNDLNYIIAIESLDRSSESDTTIASVTLSFIYENLQNKVLLTASDTLLVDEVYVDALKKGQILPRTYFLLNVDTLESLPQEVVQSTNRGVTTYYFETYEELKAIDFTLVYPK